MLLAIPCVVCGSETKVSGARGFALMLASHGAFWAQVHLRPATIVNHHALPSLSAQLAGKSSSWGFISTWMSDRHPIQKTHPPC